MQIPDLLQECFTHVHFEISSYHRAPDPANSGWPYASAGNVLIQKGSRVVAMVAFAACVLPATDARAQSAATSRVTVEDIVEFLVLNQGVQTGDFDKDVQAAEATRATISRALLASVATTPVSSSSGGFTYRLNPSLGTPERASDTFGPLYLERALTSGAGQAAVGFTFQYSSFKSLDGNDLRDGQFVTVANQFTDEPAPFDVERLQLNITSQTATLLANVGLSDRIDVGVAVPMIRLQISGSRINDYRGESLLQARASATTTGFADIALRGKVRLTPVSSATGIAAGVEARLPTGREEDLLGAGELAMRYLGIASYEAAGVGVYGNFVLGTGGLGREVSFGGGVSVSPAPHLTVIGELMLRQVAGIQNITPVVAPHPRISGVQTTRLVPGGEDVTTGFSAVGFKWNIGSGWLVNTHIVIPVSENGLTARITPTFAVDYSFGQ
jgi:hypothetical protein